MTADNSGKALRILQLEGAANDAEQAIRALRDAGMRVDTMRVSTEPEFKEALQAFSPDLVLCDVRQTSYSGLDALSFTLAHYPATPVIILTEDIEDEEVVKLLELGAKDYVRKGRLARLPFTVRRVLQEQQRIAERRHVEESLRLFRAALDQSDDAIEIVDMATMRFVDVSEGACRALGYTRDELLSMTVADIDPEFKTNGEAMLEPVKRHGEARFESIHRCKDGRLFPVELAVKTIMLDKLYGLSIARDISERKRSESLLVEARDRYQNLVENSPALIYSYSLKKGGLFYSRQVAKTLGYSLDQLYGDPFLWANVIHPDDRKRVAEAIGNINPGSRFEIEYRIRDAHGDWLWLLDRSIAIREDEDGVIIDGLAIDLTARKQAEQERLGLLHDIRHSASELETIFATQTDVILLYDQALHVSRSTPQFERDYGFDPLGMHLRDILRRVACRGMNNRPIAFSDRLPTPRALRGKYVRAKPYKVTRADGGVAIVETSSTPLHVDGGIQGVVSVWHDVTELRKAADDIAAYAKQLEKAMTGTLKAVANMVEQRDPYTAGHERRVGLIAADIAREMAMPEAQCKALEMVGLVHDIGKIGIPAEILSKPSKLSDMEYLLVKKHVENSYEILKDIKFPFPVAEIVYQHHERMDGSGYPQGLKGDDILPEARILAVADVLESMASHRPYRPALGLRLALDELTKHRGALYDVAVVDAALNLIQKQGYRLPE